MTQPGTAGDPSASTSVVIDASAAAAALLRDGPARARVGSAVLNVPDLIDTELIGLIGRYARTGRITVVAAKRALDVWGRLAMNRHSTRALVERVWSLRDSLPAASATYLALAEALGATLVTADSRMASAQGARCPIEVLAR